MYSKEESKQIKKEFWVKFGFFSQRKRIAAGLNKKWLSHNTGINCLSLKFDFENKQALVGIEIFTHNQDEKQKYYDRLLSLKTILNDSFKIAPEWNYNFELPNGEIAAKIYHTLENVKIHDKTCWPKVFRFFFENMMIYESFYTEYKEIIADEDFSEM